MLGRQVDLSTQTVSETSVPEYRRLRGVLADDVCRWQQLGGDLNGGMGLLAVSQRIGGCIQCFDVHARGRHVHRGMSTVVGMVVTGVCGWVGGRVAGSERKPEDMEGA